MEDLADIMQSYRDNTFLLPEHVWYRNGEEKSQPDNRERNNEYLSDSLNEITRNSFPSIKEMISRKY
jgi:hypothetical protein